MQFLPTIREAVDLIRAGRLTPSDLIDHCLARIHQFEDRIRAWVLVDEDGARREAERLTNLARQGEIVGPLHGIPIGIKDIIDVAGMPTRCGSPLRENAPPAEKDAAVVANLRAAGGIILGKTVTTEWACFDPPPTRNPWNLNHTPGGSSSGSAAAVAMEMCMAALGTQTGGSIIRPAAYCGVCGLKPTFGKLDMRGIQPVSVHLDHVGPLARSVADLLVVYNALCGEDEIAPNIRVEQCGIGLCDEFFLAEASDEVRTAIGDVWRKMSRDVKNTSSPALPKSFAHVHEHHWRIMAVEAADVHREAFAKSPDNFGPKVASLIEEGLATSAGDYAAALEHQQQFQHDVSQSFSSPTCWAIPSTPTTAPGLETTGDARFNSPWSYAGLPAITLPCGLDAGGLPVGLQLVGALNDEEGLFTAAAQCEKVAGTLRVP